MLGPLVHLEGGSPVTWKQAGILHVEGLTLKKGHFTAMGGKPINFQDASIKKIYENVKGTIPFFVTHVHPGDRPVGFMTEYGLTADDRLFFKGFVFDPPSIKKITIEGFDSTSAEVEIFQGKEGVEDGILKAIAFVKIPAIPGTDVASQQVTCVTPTDSDAAATCSRAAFGGTMDKAKVEEFLKSKGFTPEDISKLWAMLQEMYPSPKPPEKPPEKPVAGPEGGMSKELEAKLDGVTKDRDTIKAKLEAHEGEQIKVLVGELKALGLADPDAFIKDLPPEIRIATLKTLKERFALAKPPVTTPAAGQANMGKDGKPCPVSEIAAELGLSAEQIELLKEA